MPITLKLVYNSDNNPEIAEEIDSLEGVNIEKYDMKYSKDKNKGFKIKMVFCTKNEPFCGVYEDKVPIKGFYSEINECNIETIKKYLNDRTGVAKQ